MMRSYSRPSWPATVLEGRAHGAGVVGGLEVGKGLVAEAALRDVGLNGGGQRHGSHRHLIVVQGGTREVSVASTFFV